jgi:hypothetical protein
MRWAGAVLCGAALVLEAAGAAPAGRLAFDAPGVDFGVVDQQTTLSHVFTMRNTGAGVLQIVAIMTGCHCAVAELDSREIPPGGCARVRLEFNTCNFEGPIRKTITVRSSDPAQPLANFDYRADVRPVFVFSPPVLDFGVVEPLKRLEREVTLAGTRGRRFAIRRIACADPGLRADFSPSDRGGSQYRLRVSFAPQQNSGPFCARLTVETDQERYRDPSLLVIGTVAGSVRVEPAALFLGMVRHGEKFPSKRLVVRNTGPLPIEIRSVNPGDPALSAAVTASTPGREFHIDLTARYALPPGWLRCVLRIVTSEPGQSLDVPLSGVVRAADGMAAP